MEDTEDVGESEIYGDFTYEINEDGNAVIVSYTGTDAVVEIPEKIGDAKVISNESVQ